MDVEALLPGGVLEADHVHVNTYDETCSRCRRAIREDEVPLLMWLERAPNLMLSYCNACTGDEPEPQIPDPHGPDEL